MITRKIVLSLFVLSTVIFVACQKAENKNAAGNVPTNTTTTSNVSSSTPASASTPVSTAGQNADSPTSAYLAAHAARKNKDIEALKKLLSKDVKEFLTMLGQADEKNKQTLDDMLREMCENPQAATAEARNEKINGDKATIEYLDEKGGWSRMDFVKEDGMWKLTIEKPEKGDIEIETSPNKNSNRK